MKAKVLLVIVLFHPIVLFSQVVDKRSNTNFKDHYTIRGNIKGLKSSKAYLKLSTATEKDLVDSVKVNDGQFVFTGRVSYPTRCLIDSKDNSLFVSFYLENSEIVISGTPFSDCNITGSKTEDENLMLKKPLDKLSDSINGVNVKRFETMKSGNKVLLESINKEIRNLQGMRFDLLYKFIVEHPESYAAIQYICDAVSYEGLFYDKANKLYSNLSETLRNSEPGQELLKKMQKALGRAALDFTQFDIDGKPVKLSDYKGKYVLLDFWASWCKPCRAENPTLLKAYNKYHEKGFEILAVSLDSKKDAWLKAVKEDQLPWRHVSDLKGKKNDVAMLYEVYGIPDNFLIDPNGVIIGRNYIGEYELENVLEAIFK